MPTILLCVEGMHGSADEARVERALRAEPGVFGAVASHRDRCAELDCEAIYDWAGGRVWILTPDEGDAGAGAIRAETTRLGGHATLVRAAPATRAAVEVFEPEPAPLARISRGLREQFDPAGILNPGRMRA